MRVSHIGNSASDTCMNDLRFKRPVREMHSGISCRIALACSRNRNTKRATATAFKLMQEHNAAGIDGNLHRIVRSQAVAFEPVVQIFA